MLTIDEYQQIDRKTWSGHSHTDFCSHGSGENVEQFILKAIDSGFKTYSITEHFPMPPEFYKRASGSKHAIYTASIRYDEIDDYLDRMNDLKAKYADQIKILVGFEIDFIAEFKDWTKEQLKILGPKIDDAILSVHFLPTKEGLRAVDENTLDFTYGVLKEYESPLGVANAYLKTVEDAIMWDIANKPIRFGHIMLYRKWKNDFASQTQWENEETTSLMKNIMSLISNKNYFLDCNMAGLFRETETESSPNDFWLREAQSKEIPLVFGSDAHRVSAVNQGYNTYLENKYYL